MHILQFHILLTAATCSNIIYVIYTELMYTFTDVLNTAVSHTHSTVINAVVVYTASTFTAVLSTAVTDTVVMYIT